MLVAQWLTGADDRIVARCLDALLRPAATRALTAVGVAKHVLDI